MISHKEMFTALFVFIAITVLIAVSIAVPLKFYQDNLGFARIRQIKAVDLAVQKAIKLPAALGSISSVELAGPPEIIIADKTHLIPLLVKTRDGKELRGNALVIVTRIKAVETPENPRGFFVQTFAFPVVKASAEGCAPDYFAVFDTGYCQVPNNLAQAPS